jgi:hypothetical protein
VFGEDQFIAAGVVYVPIGCKKPGKHSKDNSYVRLEQAVPRQHGGPSVADVTRSSSLCKVPSRCRCTGLASSWLPARCSWSLEVRLGFGDPTRT